MTKLSPKKIVQNLDKFIIGQNKAKKLVAIAIRNRWRRKNIKSYIRNDIVPHNILMIGPTGVGKTEIARRLSFLVKSPFLKIEATKFTEIGYVGRDVDSIIRDLLDISIKMLKKTIYNKFLKKALYLSKVSLLNYLVGKKASSKTKNIYLNKIKSGELDRKEVEISVEESILNNQSFSTFDIPSSIGGQLGILNINEMFGKNFSNKKTRFKKLKVKDTIKYLIKKKMNKIIGDKFSINKAIKFTENQGIVFLDEVDKIAMIGNSKRNDVNKDGVQRDLLPIIEGTSVSTKYGNVKTDHILFIASGAFHISKPSDLLPELQGRLPVKVELKSLNSHDFFLILTDTENSLIKQYKELFKVENIEINFTLSGLKLISKYTEYLNCEIENIGARRLYSVFEKVLEEISFVSNEMKHSIIIINSFYIKQTLELSKFIDSFSKYII